MASTKDMTLLPGRIVVAQEAIRLGDEGQYGKLAARSVRSLSRLRGRVGVGVLPRMRASEISRGWRKAKGRWTRGESPTRLASLGTLPRKRERDSITPTPWLRRRPPRWSGRS